MRDCTGMRNERNEGRWNDEWMEVWNRWGDVEYGLVSPGSQFGYNARGVSGLESRVGHSGPETTVVRFFLGVFGSDGGSEYVSGKVVFLLFLSLGASSSGGG